MVCSKIPGVPTTVPRWMQLAVEAGQVEGDPLAGAGLLHFGAVDLHLAHPHLPARGQHLDGVADPDAAGEEGAGHHGAEAGDGEVAVDGQAQGAVGVFGRQARHRLVRWSSTSSGSPSPVTAETRQKGESRRKVPATSSRTSSSTMSIQSSSARSHLVRTTIPPPDVEQLEDLQVLVGLGHHPFHDIDHQQHQVDAADAGEHVADEALVAGDVHHAGDRAVGQSEGREAQVDGDAPGLLLLEAVGVGAGEGLIRAVLP